MQPCIHQKIGQFPLGVWAPTLLRQPRIPLRGLGLSLMWHGLLLACVSWLPLPQRSRSGIDLEKEPVTYYRLSMDFPDIAPQPPAPQQEKPLAAAPQRRKEDPTVKANVEVSVHPQEPSPTQQVLVQPDVRPVSVLPRLHLPNILLQPARPARGVEAPVAVPEISGDLSKTAQRLPKAEDPGLLLNQPRTARGIEAPVAVPEISGDLPRDAQPLSRVEVAGLLLIQPKTARGIEPAVALPEMSGDFQRDLKQGETLPASAAARPRIGAPPPLHQSAMLLGDGPGGPGNQDISSTSKTPLLAYSLDPELPKGELSVPKTQTRGSLKAGPESGLATTPPSGNIEYGNAQITIPGVSIRNPNPLPPTAAGRMVIQAPGPPPREETPKEPEKPPSKLLIDYLPTRTQPLKLGGTETKAPLPALDSPLLEAQRQGLVVYTAAINAPNFTSKRGSWIFRFTELQGMSTPGLKPLNDSFSRRNWLTAPSAVFKVDPRYPPEVIRDHVEGQVVLYAIIRKDGTVDPQSIRVLQKLDPRLDVSARDALLAWKFTPSTRDGEPIDIQTEVTIPFYSHKDPFQK